ncbi:MAG: metallophosphoesterase, partial [Propionibacteriaceae bacterium]|nr:metallophosphoesterase [Propionibacteriaceae bacterium]
MASGKDRSCLGSLFSTLVVLVLVSALIHLVHALTLDKIIEYKKVAFAPASLPSDLAGYRIAFITDTHLLPAEQLEEVIAELNQRAIDLLLLGGDFYRWGDLEATIAALARTVTSDGIYGIAGNHDNTRELFGLMEEYSIVPLSNSGVRIRQDFYLAGVEDLWNGSPDIPQAIAGSREGDFV